ncbi:TPA: hypothetical protein ENX78_08395 [Candidatus Poribacteria bacterium]|nr:hypothetical protein [Candidatus Poribacteria bacterium]
MKRSLTAKSVVIGLILVLLNVYWITAGNEIWGTVQLTIATLFFNSVFTLFILSLLNILFQRFIPRLSLSQAELIIIYVMVVMTSTVSGHTMMSFLIGGLTHSSWFATPENEWGELFIPYIPKWLAMTDRDVLKGYFEGESSFYISKNIKAWMMPILVWSAFITVLWSVMICVNIIIKRQWTLRERLAYPIIQLPLEMTTDPKAFFKSGLLWTGFAIAGGIDLINGLNFLYPSVPYIPVRIIQIGHYFRESPWDAIGSWTHISFYPFIIGMAFFMPIDLSFSCWFFYVFGKAQAVFAKAVGLGDIHTFEQSIGAWISIAIVALWLGRRHFGQVIKEVFIKRDKKDDYDSSVSYRQAVIGIFLGMTFLVLICLQAGMSLFIIGFFWILYFALAIGITRVRAELGPPDQTIIYVDPGRTIISTLGTHRVGTVNMTIISLLYALNRCNRAHPMPSQLEALKLGEESRINNRSMMTAMILATAIGIFATFWIHLSLMYHYGASVHGVMYGGETFRRLQSWLNYPKGTDFTALNFIGIGAFFTIFLMFMKSRFLWWPFHPAGYVLTTGEGMVYSWFAVFISWTMKFVILKYGGVKGYRKAMPFFFGLILGEYSIACFWSILGIVLRIPTYRSWV